MVAQRKSIHLSVVIGEDRKLVIELPPDTPTGQMDVQVVVSPPNEDKEVTHNSERERIRAKLLAAGALSSVFRAPEGIVRPSQEELRRAGMPPPGARSSEEILREIRDED
jgi:hypothetical protein